MKRLTLFVCLLAVSVFKIQAQDSPDNQKIVQLYESQRFSEAANYLESFYQDSSTNIKLINSIGYSYRMSRNYPKAALYYTKLNELDSLNITALASLAWINQQRGMQNSATELYLKILALDSTYIDAYTALASLSKRKGDIISTFNYLLWANLLQPNNSSIAIDFVDVCITLKNMSKADSVLSFALQYDPHHAGLLYSKAKISDGLKRYPDVINLTKKLIELGEGLQPVWSLLAKAYVNQSDYQAAMDTYTEAMQEFETWGEVDYYYMAISCKALKRFDEGLDYIEQALKAAISPNTGFYFAQKAGILKDLNKPSTAAATYIRSFQYQHEPIDYFNLAVLYDHDLQIKANALKYYRLYINKKPPTDEKVYIEYARDRINDLK